MCGLCGLLGEDLHWSDPLGDALPRRRERLRRIAAINQVLAVFRLKSLHPDTPPIIFPRG